MLSIKHLCSLAFILLTCQRSLFAGELSSETVFTALDVETTGLSPSRNRIIEVSAVRFQGTNIIEKRTWLVNPGVPIPPSASRVHGITDAMVKEAPAFPQICEKLTGFLTNSTVIAHNARFDWGFMAAEFQRADRIPPHVDVIDSLRVARKAFPDLKSYSLPNLAKELKLDVTPTHRAEADAVTLVLLIQRCLAVLEPDELHLLRKMRLNTQIPASASGNGLKQASE